MTEMSLTAIVIALAVCAGVIIAQVLANYFGAVDPAAAF